MMTTVAEFCFFSGGGGCFQERGPHRKPAWPRNTILARSPHPCLHDAVVTSPLSAPPTETHQNLPRSRDSGAFRAVLALRSLKGTLPHVRLQHGEGFQGREVSSGAVPQGGRRVGVQVRSRRRHARGGARCGRPVRTNGIVNRVEGVLRCLDRVVLNGWKASCVVHCVRVCVCVRARFFIS